MNSENIPQEGLTTSNPIYKSILLKSFTMVAHFVCVLLTGFVAYISKPGSSLFSWHPTLMTLSFTFFMMEGILFFSPHSSILQSYSRRTKATAHWIFMVLALISMIAGHAAIFVNKNQNGKPHLKSWHGLIGFITVVYTLAQALGGVFQVWSRLRKYLPKSVTLGKLKAYHATSGLTLYLLANTAIFLGMYSNWFTSQVTGTSWYACAACPMILLFMVMNQVTTSYLPKTGGTATRAPSPMEEQKPQRYTKISRGSNRSIKR